MSIFLLPQNMPFIIIRPKTLQHSSNPTSFELLFFDGVILASTVLSVQRENDRYTLIIRLKRLSAFNYLSDRLEKARKETSSSMSSLFSSANRSCIAVASMVVSLLLLLLQQSCDEKLLLGDDDAILLSSSIPGDNGWLDGSG